MVGYLVGNKIKYSKYLALYESWKTGQPVQFYCFDHEYDLYDWTKEPEINIEVLYDQHAAHLRDKHQRLILLWSGGTDSHTIYNVFARNRIHLDEIIVKTSKHLPIFPESAAHWVRQNHWDSTTTITVYDENDPDLRALDITDENWVWKDKGDLLKYGMTSSAEGVKFLCEKNHSGHRWCAIGGYEKPRLVYRNGRWYSRQMDIVLLPTMGYNYIHHFFLEPLIHIKQSYMVKHAVKSILSVTKQPLYDGDWAETKWPRDKDGPTAQGYRDWAVACGRHDELNLGISHLQKSVNQELEKMEINLTSWKSLENIKDRKLTHDLAEGSRVALNYISGFHNLYGEHQFRQWMSDNNWIDKDSCWTKTKAIWSKEYDLGE